MLPFFIFASQAYPMTEQEKKVAAMVELVDTRDLKSLGQKWLCGFESRSRHFSINNEL